MKKIISIILCLTLVLGMAAIVSATETTATKVTTLSDGDQIVIMSTDNVALTNTEYTYTDKYGNNKQELVTTEEITVTDGSIAVPSDASVLTVKVTNGHYEFVNENGKYLYADGTDVKYVSASGEYTLFDLEAAEDGAFYIKSTNATYTNTSTGEVKAQYLEIYSGYITCYSFNSSKTYLYTFEFYKLPASTPSTDATTGTTDATTGTTDATTGTTDATTGSTEGSTTAATTASKTEYHGTLLSEVKDGDKVVIYSVANSSVMTASEYTYEGKSYNKIELEQQEVSVKDKTVTYHDGALVLTVHVDGDTVSFTAPNGSYLYLDGTDVKLVSSASEYTNFVLEKADGGYFIKSSSATYTNSNGETFEQYLEVYSGYFTCYSKYETSDPSLYTFQFYSADPDTPAATGDSISVIVALLAVSALGVAVIGKKKEF